MAQFRIFKPDGREMVVETIQQAVEQLPIKSINIMAHLVMMQDLVDHTFVAEDVEREALDEIDQDLRALNKAFGKHEATHDNKMFSECRSKLGKTLDKYCTVKGKGVLFEMIFRLHKRETYESVVQWLLRTCAILNGDPLYEADPYDWMQ